MSDTAPVIEKRYHEMLMRLTPELPTFLAAAGEPDIKDKLLKGHQAGGKRFKVHLDGYNQLDMLMGNGPSDREELFYFSDDGDLMALRYGDWKMVFMEQRAKGTLLVWSNPFTPLRVPKLFHLRRDPYERADIKSNTYWDWWLDRAFAVYAAQAIVGNFLQSFQDFPPRGKAASFTIDDALEKIKTPRSN